MLYFESNILSHRYKRTNNNANATSAYYKEWNEALSYPMYAYVLSRYIYYARMQMRSGHLG